MPEGILIAREDFSYGGIALGHVSRAVEKLNTPSFRLRRMFSVNRGALRAEESLFS